ncbi:MAG: ArnT family glycosyltransferase [Prochlorotrichaceae cyanobacterium]|jgi:4-amino-4-deoxy-L-arabinose transferase-like glycosyltransferase
MKPVDLMQSPRTLSILLTLWILGLGALAFLWHLGSVGLVDETEPLFAEAARQMLVRQDWITPYFNDVTRFDKPPLIYWLMAIAYQILGVNEWAVRLPSALAAMVLMAGVGYTLVCYGNSLGGKGASAPTSPLQPAAQGWISAFLATAMTAFSGEMLVWGRVGVSDMLLNGCMGCCLLCFFQGYASPDPDPKNNRWYFAAYTFCALAILTKGPIGIVLPGLIVLSFLAYTGQWSVLRELRLGLGLAWVALLSIPWYLLVIRANGEAYIDSFFGYHNLERFTQVVNHHSAPWYFYFLVVLVGFAPWSLYLPATIGSLRLWQWRRWRSLPRHRHLGLFAGCWFGVTFSFFTIAVTKLPSYVLPLMPAAAILVALYWSDLFGLPATSETSPPARSHRFPLVPLLNVGFLGVLGLIFLLQSRWLPRIEDPAMPTFATDLEATGLLTIAGGISLTAAIVSLLLILYRRKAWLWGTNFLGFVLIFVFTLIPVTFTLDQHRQAPLRDLAEVLTQVRQPEEPILMLGLEKPSIVFYSHQSIHFFRFSQPARDFLAQIKAEGATTVLLITYPRRFADVGLTEDGIEVLSQQGVYALGRIQIQ